VLDPASIEGTAAVLAAAPDCVKILSATGTVRFMNQQGLALLDAESQDQVIGKPYREFWPAAMQDAIDAAVLGASAGEHTAVEGGAPTLKGRQRWWEVNFHGVNAQDGVVQIICIARDVTQRHERELQRETVHARLTQELDRVDQQRTEFIAMLAHELRNPLAPVRTGLELLKQAGHALPEVERIRVIMERQIGQMVHLIDDLLDLARLKSGRIHLQCAPLALQSVLAASIDASATQVRRLDQIVSLKLPDEDLYVSGDVTRLVQVFTNLLNNAAKYSERGSRITVHAEREEGMVAVSVVDTGAGIAPGAMPFIFEMFNTVGRNKGGSSEGLGIGLNLVRRLVELHLGQVSATSDGLGMGSTFAVRLPLIEKQMPVPATPAVQSRSREHVRILLVDDNVDAAETWAMLLEDDKRKIYVASSGVRALQLVDEVKPDIVFLDIGMPEMDGYAVARAIHQMPQAGAPFLVALTGWGSREDRDRSRAAGFHAHLTKPADLEAMESMLGKLPERPA
jgi:PAS domain S-box-containing protein